MSSVAVVVEGKADAEFMARILDDEVRSKRVAVKAASGRSAADSMARTILGFGERAVVLVVDADTNNESRANELRNWLQDSLGMMGHKDRFLVSLMVPEFEAIFFKEPQALEQALGRSLSEDERIRSRYEPKQVLARILRPKQTLTPELLTLLRQHPQIQAIREFIHRHTSVNSNAA